MSTINDIVTAERTAANALAAAEATAAELRAKGLADAAAMRTQAQAQAAAVRANAARETSAHSAIADAASAQAMARCLAERQTQFNQSAEAAAAWLVEQIIGGTV